VNVGVVDVPDPRLAPLAAMFRPRKTTPARVEYIDQATTSAGESYAPALYQSDLLLVVLRAFEDPGVPHPLGSVDPARDAKRFLEDMILRDLALVEGRLERVAKQTRVGAGGALGKERDLLARAKAALEAETPLRRAGLAADDEVSLRGFQLLTLRPVLFVVNLGEGAIGAEGSEALARLQSGFPDEVSTEMCAKVEMEIAALDGEERLEYMRLVGIPEPSVDRLIRVSYGLLGLESFFTVGPDEVRAWTIRKGTKAQEAAGVIHSDLARGFIRAEVFPVDDLLAHGGIPALREKGLLRVEGRDYVVKDGDVLNVRFSVSG
jgi:GTP-binding protein YchF